MKKSKFSEVQIVKILKEYDAGKQTKVNLVKKSEYKLSYMSLE